jgi:hypothetical protein
MSKPPCFEERISTFAAQNKLWLVSNFNDLCEKTTKAVQALDNRGFSKLLYWRTRYLENHQLPFHFIL